MHSRDSLLRHEGGSEQVESIFHFPSSKALGHDKASMSALKDALPCILPILTVIVNHSLLNSVFPTAWKKSEVIPLLKEHDHEIATTICVQP